MKRAIEITVSPLGEVLIDAVGFKGTDCEAATRFLEQALGVPAQKVRKPEYRQSAQIKPKQHLGQ